MPQSAPTTLSDWVRVRDSPIHGKGVFARRPIPHDTMIGVYAGAHVEHDGTYVLWVEEEDGLWRGVDGLNELRFLNHSSKPNSQFNGDILFSTRTIAAGEELTIHYGDDWSDVD